MVRYSYPCTGLERSLGVQDVEAAYVFFLVFSSLYSKWKGLKVSNDLFGMTVKKLSLYWPKEAIGASRSGSSQNFKTAGI
jgi:hypothetical protein